MGKGEESRLQLLREKRGMSRKDLAEMCKISFRTLQDYEQGHKDIFSAKAETLLRLSLALDCDMEELLNEKDRKNVYEEMRVQHDWEIRVGDTDILVETIKPQDRTRQTYRLMMYYLGMKGEAFIPIEKYVIKSPEYKVEGRWKIEEGMCYLKFKYEDCLVGIPFHMDFSPEMIPWLIDVAGLKIDCYIRSRKHEKQDMIMGGEAWDES